MRDLNRRRKSVYVQVFGCRHDEAIHALRRPASEKRQGTKSREVDRAINAGFGYLEVKCLGYA